MKNTDIKMTPLMKSLLKIFIDYPQRDFYGLELSKVLRKPYGSILPLLMRLEKAGWLATDLENIDPKEQGRPKRKYYCLTDKGKAEAYIPIEEEKAFWTGKVVLT